MDLQVHKGCDDAHAGDADGPWSAEEVSGRGRGGVGEGVRLSFEVRGDGRDPVAAAANGQQCDSGDFEAVTKGSSDVLGLRPQVDALPAVRLESAVIQPGLHERPHDAGDVLRGVEGLGRVL